MTDPTKPDRAGAIAISLEDDATPLVLLLGSRLSHRLGDPAFAEQTAGLRGTVVLRSPSTPQAATVRLAGARVSLTHGAVDGAEVEVSGDLDHPEQERLVEGGERHPELARWVAGLLEPPNPPWTEAAQRFWSVLSERPGSPAGLSIVNLDSGEHRRLGSEDGTPYEIHGSEEALVGVLTGELSFLDAAYVGAIRVRGSFPDLSVLSGVGYAIRLGEEGRR